MQQYILYSSSELETVKIAFFLSEFSRLSCNIYLYGQIGLGKTSFCRGFLKGLGYVGCVKSPSYTFFESYVFTSLVVYHFDFYRLNSIQELEYVGVLDYFNCGFLCLVEWPNLMKGVLPREDIAIILEYHELSLMRKIKLKSFTFLGESILKKFFNCKSVMMYDEVKVKV